MYQRNEEKKKKMYIENTKEMIVISSDGQRP